MKEDIDKLKKIVEELQNQVKDLTFQVKTLSETSYKTSTREIINREIQFMQKCYDKSGTLITEINPT